MLVKPVLFLAFFGIITMAMKPLPTFPLASKAAGLECNQCIDIVNAADKIASNKTTLVEFVTNFKSSCDTLYPGNTNELMLALCKSIGDDLGWFLPWARDQLITLAYDEPIAVCAVFLQTCTMDCCDASTPLKPEQLHLSYLDDPTTMGITWVTLHSSPSVVEWSQAGSSPRQAQGSIRTYTEAGWIGQIHSAVMTGLQPGTTYNYRVGDGSTWSALFNFTTFPANIGSVERPLKLVVIGDMGYAKKSDITIATVSSLVAAGQVDAVLHAGDISYADGFMKHWDVFFRKIEPIAAHVPYIVGPGNHEFWFNFSAYKHRFFMPNFDQTENMFFSLNIGPVHFTVFDTETFIDTPDINPVQMAWLKADLAKANQARSQQPWLLASGHRPLYCNNGGSDCGDRAQWLRTLAEELFLASKVDLVLTAHMHGFERFYPMYNFTKTNANYTNPLAPIHVVNGAGGNRESNSDPHASPLTGFHTGHIGFATITVTGAHRLDHRFFADNGTLMDAFTVTK